MGGGGSPLHGSGGPLRGGGPSGRGKPLGGRGPLNGKGPLGGGGGGFPVRGGTCVPFGAPWPNSLWNPSYPPWYPPLAPTTPMVPSLRKALPYPIYFVKTNLNVHV
jgi:hypothetical protein